MRTEKPPFWHFLQSTGFIGIGVYCLFPHFSYPSEPLSNNGITRPHFLQRASITILSFSENRCILENGRRLISPTTNTSKSCALQHVSTPSIMLLSRSLICCVISKYDWIFFGIKFITPNSNNDPTRVFLLQQAMDDSKTCRTSCQQ